MARGVAHNRLIPSSRASKKLKCADQSEMHFNMYFQKLRPVGNNWRIDKFTVTANNFHYFRRARSNSLIARSNKKIHASERNKAAIIFPCTINRNFNEAPVKNRVIPR